MLSDRRMGSGGGRPPANGDCPILIMPATTEYHPPMTALEAHMEEEIAHEAGMKPEAEVRVAEFGTTAPVATENKDQAVEEAMLLGQ